MDAKREQQLKKIVGEMQKRFGKESVNYLGNSEIEPMRRIRSQSRAIDAVTGGGYPLGRIVEIYGGESSGKTTACYHAIAEAQREFPDKFCGFIDSENSFDPVYAAACGVNVSELVTSQPESGTVALAILEGFVKAGFSLVVVDSVAAMVPREEVEEEDFGKSLVGVQARMMSRGLRKLVGVIGSYGAVVIFTNQTREKVGILYGNPETTSGGNSLKFYASIRLKLSKIGAVEEGTGDSKRKVSIRTRVEAVKNKTAAPFRRAELIISFGKGIDDEQAYFQAIVDSGLFAKKGGGWYAYEGKNVAQGDAQLKTWLDANPEAYERARKLVDEQDAARMSGKPVADKADGETAADDPEELQDAPAEETGLIA